MQSEAMIRKAAEAIWAIRREEEDRCDMSLDDMGGEESSVWQEAKAALEAALSAAEPVAAMTTDYLGCEYVSMDVAGIEKIAAAHSKGPTEVVYLYAAPRAPSVAVKAKLIAELREMAGSITYAEEPSRVMREAADALSAQVQDDSEIVDCLLAGKPFVFDPATNFCHADDGGAPEHGIKYVPAAQVQDVAIPEGWQLVPIEPTQEMLDACGPKPKHWDATPSSRRVRESADRMRREDYKTMLAAAPAKQEG